MEHKKIKIGGIYKHFKGNKYQVIGIAKDSDTLRNVIVYKAMYGDGNLWVRKEEEFLDEVERDGKKFIRFELEE